jgi:hypothetical protein
MVKVVSVVKETMCASSQEHIKIIIIIIIKYYAVVVCSSSSLVQQRGTFIVFIFSFFACRKIAPDWKKKPSSSFSKK